MTQTIPSFALRTEAVDPSSGVGPQLPNHPPSPSFEDPTSVRHASSRLASLDSEESSVRESKVQTRSDDLPRYLRDPWRFRCKTRTDFQAAKEGFEPSERDLGRLY